MKAEVLVRGHYEDLSFKDLVNVVPVLKKNLNNKGLERTILTFETYLAKAIYVSYRTHLAGLSHHRKQGPSRRPFKVYRYLISVLKNLRGAFKSLKEKDQKFKISRILVNSTGFKRGGVIRRSHGSASPKKRKHHTVVFCVQNSKLGQ